MKNYGYFCNKGVKFKTNSLHNIIIRNKITGNFAVFNKVTLLHEQNIRSIY